MRATDLTDYLRDTAGVEGWFFPVDAHLFALVDEIQQDLSLTGDLFEIGVHHGKTALLLLRMRRANEQVGVCDVFGRQDLNVDHSGEGSEELFLRNVREYAGGAESALRLFARRSDSLTADDTGRNCRFFHIDGGHLPENVVADLEIAREAIHQAGVVVVDDVFNSNWPGVAEGFFRFMADRPQALVPMLIGGNKVFLTRPEAVASYDERFTAAVLTEVASRVPYTFERKRWLGRDVLTAIRHQWVDLDPQRAANAHLGR